ncbi:MAG: ABC-type phosphate transport system substrate-binding protein [Planctomycetota bacterium]|jgi:ABC-type phosphate transport system substrate-binding protein
MIASVQASKALACAALLWLAATTLLAAHAIAQDGNLCSWSPDGLKLLFVGRDSERQFVARYDIATQSATCVFLANRGERIHAVQWSQNGKQFAAVCVPTIATRRYQSLVQSTLHVLTYPLGRLVMTLAPHKSERATWGSPIWLPNRLLIEAPGMVECDLTTGKMHAWSRPPMEADAFLGAFGTGIGYLSVKPSATGGWSLGTIDVTNLTRTVYCDHQLAPEAKIQFLPAFAASRERIALPAVVGTTRSLLLFEPERLLETRALAPELSLQISDLQWAANGKTIYLLVQREVDEDKVQHTLMETEVHADSLRETKLFTTSAQQRSLTPHGLIPRSLAISSNGRTAAIVAGQFGGTEPALYLVDLDRPERTVTVVPFPKPNQLILSGSDRMMELANHWRDAYQSTKVPQIELIGGGSRAGFEQLLKGIADVALMVRQLTGAERAEAAAAGLELVTTLARREALAVCVHPDNALAAIEPAQLTRLFTKHEDHRWSQLGVKLAASGTDQDKIAMAMFLPGSRHYMPFRTVVLTGQSTTHQPTTKELPQDLAKFVAANKNAIACLPMSEALRQGAAVRIVPVKSAEPAPVAPTTRSIADGHYGLVYSWFVVHDKKGRKRGQAFCEWLASKVGQARTATFRVDTDK